MNFNGKKFVASYSGGKDSILAMKAILSGAQIYVKRAGYRRISHCGMNRGRSW